MNRVAPLKHTPLFFLFFMLWWLLLGWIDFSLVSLCLPFFLLSFISFKYQLLGSRDYISTHILPQKRKQNLISTNSRNLFFPIEIRYYCSKELYASIIEIWWSEVSALEEFIFFEELLHYYISKIADRIGISLRSIEVENFLSIFKWNSLRMVQSLSPSFFHFTFSF